MDATDIRLAIIPKFLAECDTSMFEAIFLTGSMVFGKHYSVHENSDIDVILVLDASRVTMLRTDPLFGGLNVNDDFISAFEKQLIDRFWLDYFVEDIKINIGIWGRQFVDDFTAMQADKHVLGTTNANAEPVEAIDVSGKMYRYNPVVERYGNIYMKTFELRHNDMLVGSPSYNNLFASEALYDPEGAYSLKIASLIKGLNSQYGNLWQEYFLQYVRDKSSPEYIDVSFA